MNEWLLMWAEVAAAHARLLYREAEVAYADARERNLLVGVAVDAWQETLAKRRHAEAFATRELAALRRALGI